MIKKVVSNYLPAIIFFSILFALFFLAPGFEGITGRAVSNSITIEVPNSTESGSPILGSIELLLTQPILASSALKLEFNGLTEKPLKVILDELSIPYEESGETITPTNPKSSITLIYPSAGQQQTALKLPAGAVIDSIEMDIAGLQQASEYPYFPYMDVEGDGKKEWQHFGNLLGYLPQNITPSGLSLTGAEGITKIKDSTTNYFYCEQVSLPYAKDFTIRTKYSLYDASRTGGDIKAVILTFTDPQTYDVSGGGNNCDLPESLTSIWNSCAVHFDNPIEGDALICIYNSNAGNSDQDFYKLSNDQSVKSTGFVCDQPISGSSACTKITSSDDFYILASPANYSRRLDSAVKFSAGFTQNPIELALNSYLESCPSTDSDCAVPIKIISGSKGQIKLSNLVVSYTIGSLSKEENNFYDVQYSPSKITSINDILLTQGANLSIPLDYFELSAPSPSLDFESYDLSVSLDSLSAVQTINVSKVFNASELESTTKASAIKSRLEAISTRESELLKLTGIDLSASISELNDYQSQIDLIVQSSKPPSQKEAEIAAILSSMESSLATIPVTVRPIESVTDIFAAEPDDITPEILLPNQNKLDLYNYQNEVSIKTSATNYELETYSGAKEAKTLIRHTVTANILDAYIIEVIPKSIAVDVNKITFSVNPDDVINADPIVRWYYPSLATESISYLVNGNAMPYINNIKTIVVPENIPIKQKAVCGDSNCSYVTVDGKRRYIETAETCPVDCKSKTPWGWIIFLLLILILGVYYINWYRGKYAFKEITGGLFSSKTDFNNLYRYIQTALQQKVPKEKIESKLIEKGWTKHQIAYVFRKVQSAGKPKPKLLDGIKSLFRRKK